MLSKYNITNNRTDRGGNNPYPARRTPLCKFDPAFNIEFGRPDPIAAGFGTCCDRFGLGLGGIPGLYKAFVTISLPSDSCETQGST